jgi:hypothetical protein
VANKDLLSAVLQEARVVRLGELVTVQFPAGGFATTAEEWLAVQRWCRSRLSSGIVAHDIAAVVGRVENLIAQAGSSFATRGNRSALQRIVRLMKRGELPMEFWCVPRELAVMDSAPATGGAHPSAIRYRWRCDTTTFERADELLFAAEG